MKPLIIMKPTFFFLVLIFISSCGSSSSDAPAASDCSKASAVWGTYSGSIANNADTLVISSNCTGSSSYCGGSFTYTADTSTVVINVTGSNGKYGCLSNGATSCAYVVRSSTLSFNCGASTLTYTKQ